MIKYSRIKSENNRHPSKFQSKWQLTSIAPDAGDQICLYVEETVLPICADNNEDVNWFLATGVRQGDVSACQLGVGGSMTLPPTFPGEVTYRIRSGKNITRASLELYPSNS